MRSRFLACLLLATAAPLAPAQTPLHPPVPLVAAGAPDALAPGQAAATLAAAERAQAMGFSSIAVELYRRLLAAPAGGGGDPWQLRLALATALLDDGRLGEAGQVLNEDVRARDPAWQLRAGLIAAQTKQADSARASLAVIKPEELSAADRGWYFFLQGMVADAAGDWDRGRAAYGEALKAAGNEMERTRFELAQELAYLRRGVANLDAQRQNAERIQGRYGYEASRQYAIGLDAAGRKGEAVTVLQRLLAALPAEERAESDKVRLLLGLVAGAAEGVGRNALFQLLTTCQDPAKQRIALHLLAQHSARGAAALEFRRKLDELIGAPSPHPILEYLRLYRAQAALVANEYAQAEADAKELLNRFPGSPLRAQALGVLTSSAWEQDRYRSAADYATQARGELPDGAARRQLGVLVAEAWYRAGEYRNAADAYGAVLGQPPPGGRKSDLLFQRVQAEIEAGGLQAAPALLDQLGRDPDFDTADRWEAEWNLARALQTAGQTTAALARVNQLLAAAPTPAAQPAGPRVRLAELGARLAWLQVRLSYDAGQYAEAERLAGKLAPALAGVTAELRTEIASSAALLKTQAEFKLGQPAVALESLKKLRADFPKSDAAVYSYIVEAEYYAEPGRDQTVEAQKLLTKLAEDYRNSPYAPYALYRAAQLAERRGQDDNFKEANRLLVDLALNYPQSDLVFYARLKQGDLLRKLNDFPAAQQVYESLINTFPRHSDGFAAQMALADCRAARAATDPTQLERAAEIYERLLYMAAPDPRTELPVELRVEAGYKLGASLNRRGQPARAQEIWWRDVVNEYLLKAGRAAQLGTKGRYWMGRTLVDLGTLCEQQEKLEEARQAWQLVVDSKLPGAALAQAKLARFNLPPLPAKP
ncbi:MAG TPA: tetratricopeptide repeat protein [Opitutaceae bacterium]|nr:tetratricopeptide repeat protein [Opitutaceae bacterium]